MSEMSETQIGNMLRDLHEQTALLREMRDFLALLAQGKHRVITPAMMRGNDTKRSGFGQ